MVKDNEPRDDISLLRSRVQQQGDVVRALKSQNAPEYEIKKALVELKLMKKNLEEKEIELSPTVSTFDRAKLEDLLKQKFFYDQAFSIYGGIQGLYDFGPMGCAMKSNLVAAWRDHFILADHLLEVECPMLTPHAVLKASGHVQRFTDQMVKDTVTGECYRADHLLKATLEAKLKHKKTTESEKENINKILTMLDNYDGNELNEIIREYNIKAPTTNNDLTEPQQFNLMFETMIGPTGQCKGYLRPETAQGIFVNFQRLLHFNLGRIPFGAAQIGSSFRNEISPRSGLIRVREFAMAEIEYFVDPADKRHPKFDQVKDVEVTLYSACDQMGGQSPKNVTIGEAVKQGTIANETLGYFMARIHLFLIRVGVDIRRLRFRQHLSNEMAHYACDCWDAECQTSYGWVECVGCADRSCYDLTQHSKATGARLVAEKQRPEPITVRTCECKLNKQAIGKAFRTDAKTLTERLNSLSLDEAVIMKEDLAKNGKSIVAVEGKQYDVDKSMITIEEKETTSYVEEIVPNVIEPSFGIGRVLYAVFEHCFRIREGDEQRTYLSVPPILAPYKCSILPLSNHRDFAPYIRDLSVALTRVGVSHRVDDSSGSIGRRYARTDQIAIPYGITVDFDTVNKTPASATLRERDSMKQVRVPIAELPSLINDLANGLLTWSETQAKYPAFEQQETGQQEPAIKHKELLESPPISQDKRNLSYTTQADIASVVGEKSLPDPTNEFKEKLDVTRDETSPPGDQIEMKMQDVACSATGEDPVNRPIDVDSTTAAGSLQKVVHAAPPTGSLAPVGMPNEQKDDDDDYLFTTLSLDQLRFGEYGKPADIPTAADAGPQTAGDGDFPPLPNTVRSHSEHHGLFSGPCWTSNRSVVSALESTPTAGKQQAADRPYGKRKEKPAVVSPPAKEEPMVPTQSDHTSRNCDLTGFPLAIDWRVALSRVYENVGELGVRQTAEDALLHLQTVTGAVAIPVAGQEKVTDGTQGKEARVDNCHGVFVGTSWSAAESKGKAANLAATDQTATGPSHHKKKADQLPSTVAATADHQEARTDRNLACEPDNVQQPVVNATSSMDRASCLLDGILKETISELNLSTSGIIAKSIDERVDSDQWFDPNGEESASTVTQKNAKPVSSIQSGNPAEFSRKDSLLTQASSMRSVVNFLHQTDPVDESCISLDEPKTTPVMQKSITEEQSASEIPSANPATLSRQGSTTSGKNIVDSDLSNKQNQAGTTKRSKGSRKHKPKRKK